MTIDLKSSVVPSKSHHWSGFKCVVLGAKAISDFDSTAAEALENLEAELERHAVELWIARANGPLRNLLQTTGLTTRIGQEKIHVTVRAAVIVYRARFFSVLPPVP